MLRASLVVVMVIVVGGCKRKPADKRPKGKLCFAPNPAELFRWKKDDVETDFTEGGKALAIKYRGKAIPLPNAQVGFEDAREGEPVAVMRGDKLLESWKVSWKLGTDLCYSFRTFDPAKPERRPGFILNVAEPDDRCTCW